MFLTKSILGIALGAALGAAIGYSELLCPDGGCQITGSWYGGAMFGGIMGLALTGAIGGQAAPGRVEPTNEQAADGPDGESADAER